MPGPDITGPNIDQRREVIEVKRALEKIGIDLGDFDIAVTGVYVKPRPYGFDFACGKPQALLAKARSVASLAEDDRDTLEGAIAAKDTHGDGFREMGAGPRVHLEVAMDGKCNVHIDSHGFVVGNAKYDLNRALEHGYWDLAPDNVPGLYGSFGDRGQVGPAVVPMQGVDGKMRWVVGLVGHW